jgi:hypothetical protein
MLSGCFWLVGIVLLFDALGWLASVTTPIGAYLFVALILCGHTAGSSRPWLKAVNAVLLPIVLGLLVLSCCLLVLNVFLHAHNGEPIRSAEFGVVRVAGSLSRLTTISEETIVPTLVLLVLVSMWAPQWRLITRFLWCQRYVQRTVTTVAFVAGFSFFTGVTLADRSDAALERIRAAYVGSRGAELDQIARNLNTRIAITSLAKMSLTDRAYIAAVCKEISAISSLSAEATTELATVMADPTDLSLAADLDAKRTSLGPIPQSQADALLTRPADVLHGQQAAERAAIETATQTERGLKEVLLSTLTLPTTHAADIGVAFLDRFVQIHSAATLDVAKEYLDKVLEEYVKRGTKSFVDERATQIDMSLHHWIREPATRDVDPGERVQAVLHELAVDRPAQLAEEAKVAASGAQTAVKSEDYELAGRLVAQAEAEAQEATYLTTSFAPGVAAPPAPVDVALVAAPVDAVPDAARMPREAAAAVQLARESVLEARTARAALEAAEAAQDALKAVEFIRHLH